MQQHGSKYFARKPPPTTTLGDEVKRSKINFFFYNTVMLQIKLNRIKNAATWSQMSQFYPQTPPPPPHTHTHTLTLWLESKGQNSTFSKHGHVANQIKGNHECSNIVANILPADTPHPEDGVNRSKSTFSEYCHVAYLITGNHKMQQYGRIMVDIVQISLFSIELATEN